MQVRTWLLPDLVEPSLMVGRSAVAIDVLRASTTIITALEAGAACVYPCLEIDQALSRANDFQPRGLLGGERQGVKIDGFDLGNSPGEYLPDRVAGRTICFTSTNGTKALDRCSPALAVAVGAFVNRAATATWLANRLPGAIVCAGTNRAVTREDVLAAGAILATLIDVHHVSPDECDDSSLIALTAWREIAPKNEAIGQESLVRQLQRTQGGRNLQRLNLSADLSWAAALDRSESIPTLDSTTGMLTLMS